jgi:CBS domain-containing protein
MQVSEVMHQGVKMAQILDSFQRVANLMKKNDIGIVPIYKNERPVGIVTDRDIVVSGLAHGHRPDEPISLAMTHKVISVYEDQNINEAIHLMEENQISRLLVLDRGERPVGVLSLQDLAREMPDDHTKAEVLSEIKRS